MAGFLNCVARVDVSCVSDMVDAAGSDADHQAFSKIIHTLPIEKTESIWSTKDFDSLLARAQGVCDWANHKYCRGRPIRYVTAIRRNIFDRSADLTIEITEEVMNTPAYTEYVWHAKKGLFD